MRMLVAIVVMLAATAAPHAAFALEKTPIELTTSDNVKVSGYFVKGSQQKGPAVVLLHMLGGKKEDWDAIIEKQLLSETPFSYLAIDLRGHGKSLTKNGENIYWRNFSDADFAETVKDVAAAVEYLRGRSDVDGNAVAVVGASIGANIAINYAATDPKIKAVAMLSAASDYHGITVAAALGRYGDRPIFLAASSEDLPAGKQLGRLAARAKGRKVFTKMQGNLHGTRMFEATPVGEYLVAFLNTYLK